MKKILVIGSGLAGSTCSRILAENGHQVYLHEMRPHVGGNIYDFRSKTGILVHKYGPHAFHTNSESVWYFVNKFAEWTSYEHRVRAEINGFLVPIPLNFTSVDLFFPENSEEIKNELISITNSKNEISISKLLENKQSKLLIDLANFAFSKVFYGYSKKQWGMDPGNLGSGILDRVPIRASYDDRYFTDKFQGLPAEGYTKFIETILSHKNIKLTLGSEITLLDIENKSWDAIIYTGPLDKLFQYSDGSLEYRSLRFVNAELFLTPSLFPTAQTNFPNSYEYTRITDYSKFYDYSELSAGVYSTEYPSEYSPGVNEPFYPLTDEANRKMHLLYKAKLDDLSANVHIVGRLAEYRYFNMDQVIASAMTLAKSLL